MVDEPRRSSAAQGSVGLRKPPRLRSAKRMVVLSVRSAHCLSMAKTWVSKNDRKSQKAFVKAMRALVAPKGRGNTHSRPR
jgi:hypothetical protein